MNFYKSSWNFVKNMNIHGNHEISCKLKILKIKVIQHFRKRSEYKKLKLNDLLRRFFSETNRQGQRYLTPLAWELKINKIKPEENQKKSLSVG